VRHKPALAPDFNIEVVTRGAADYARRKIGGLGRLTHQPVLFARVKPTKHHDRAVHRPVLAQPNVDVDGRPVRAQVEAVSAPEAIDRLEARLRCKLEGVAEHCEAHRGTLPVAGPRDWRHTFEPTTGRASEPRSLGLRGLS
jgi:hypothetical protein